LRLRELRTEEGSDLVGIALYTEPDTTAPFVREADESLSLGPALRTSASGAMRPAYLDHERVLAALRADARRRRLAGLGFLAEDPGFVGSSRRVRSRPRSERRDHAPARRQDHEQADRRGRASPGLAVGGGPLTRAEAGAAARRSATR
jgi:hypothetical protein